MKKRPQPAWINYAIRLEQEECIFQVLGLRRVKDTEPQEFEIQLRDNENKNEGYVMTTDYGTEPELRR